MVKPIGRNEPCPCGSGKKYKKCCMKKSEALLPEQFVDNEGFHFTGKGEQPDSNELKKMEKNYQNQVRNSPLWDEMVEEYGLEKAEKLLKEFKVKTK